MVWSSVTARKISRALFPTKSTCFVMELYCRFVRTSFPFYLEGTITFALLLFQRIFLFHVQFVNGMNTSYVQIRNELASEQLIKVQFQVAMSGRYIIRSY